MSRKSKKLQDKVRKGYTEARISEKMLLRQIKKIQKSERRLLLEIRTLIDENQIKEARILAMNIIDSRKTIQKLGKMRLTIRNIQMQFKEAQTALIKGETVENLVNALGYANRLVNADSIDEAFLHLETETETLSNNLEEADNLLEDLGDFTDPLANEEEFVDTILVELGKIPSKKVNAKIDEILKIDSLLPKVPETTAEKDKEFEVESLK